MIEITKNSDGLRSLSQLFSPSSLKVAINNSDYRNASNRIKKHSVAYESSTFHDIYISIYNQMFDFYRNEYQFKNAIFNELILKKYPISNSTVLNEFRIGKSCADLMLLNGKIRIYEIKTSLDDLGKLEKQIGDYSKIADEVYVVCSPKHSESLRSNLSETAVGIIEFSSKGTFRKLKKAANLDSLDHTAIFKTLRKPEYLQIIKNEFGFIPEVPNTKIFRECLELALMIPIKRFQKLTLAQLKQRSLAYAEGLMDHNTPYEFRYLCYAMNLNFDEYNYLYKFLNKRIR